MIDDVSNEVSSEDDVNNADDDDNDDDSDDVDDNYNDVSKTEIENLKYALHKVLITHYSEELKGGVQIRIGKNYSKIFSNLNHEMQDVATRSGLLTETRIYNGNSRAANWQRALFQDARYMLGIGREKYRGILRGATESRTIPTLLPTSEQQLLIIEELMKLRDDIDPSSSVSPKTTMFFSKKNMKRAIMMANVDYNSTMKMNNELFAYNTVHERAKRLGLSSQFNFEVYKNYIFTTISAK